MSTYFPEACKDIEKAKSYGLKTIIGGAHIICDPEQSLIDSQADYAAIGEGESRQEQGERGSRDGGESAKKRGETKSAGDFGCGYQNENRERWQRSFEEKREGRRREKNGNWRENGNWNA